MNLQNNPHPASYRDPAGFLYEREGNLYRFVANTYKENFELLVTSGLEQQLIQQGQLLRYEVLAENHFNQSNWFTTLRPQYLPFLSYAWEWSFHQLKDAALCTLRICKQALDHGFVLKDATHLNIQFVENKPLLIDHLSLEKYEEGTPWIAYRQFCECFLNPLLLSAYKQLDVSRLLKAYPEGVPATVTASLLPYKTKLNPVLYLHVHLQAKMSGHTAPSTTSKKAIVSLKSLRQILENLESIIEHLNPKETRTTWNNYYEETILSKTYLDDKKVKVTDWIQSIEYHKVLDLGANEGAFSLLCKSQSQVIASDFDNSCIDRLYMQLKKSKIYHIHPVILDWMQPSPAMGWENKEQASFLNRCKSDLCLALAVIHHLCIGKNLPFEKVASVLSDICSELIIEYVPKSDPKVRAMLATRKDIFDHYNQEAFENAMLQYFNLIKSASVEGSDRILYHFQKSKQTT